MELINRTLKCLKEAGLEFNAEKIKSYCNSLLLFFDRVEYDDVEINTNGVVVSHSFLISNPGFSTEFDCDKIMNAHIFSMCSNVRFINSNGSIIFKFEMEI